MTSQDLIALDQLAQAAELCKTNNLPYAARWISNHFRVIDGMPIHRGYVMFFNTYKGDIDIYASEPDTEGKFAGIIQPMRGNGYMIRDIIVTRFTHDTPEEAIEAAKMILEKIRGLDPHSL